VPLHSYRQFIRLFCDKQGGRSRAGGRTDLRQEDLRDAPYLSGGSSV
jgi:hypothetical protein